MIEEIKAAVHRASGSRQKIAMFHLQVLQHAKELEGVDPAGLCGELGVPLTYQTEFRKMLGLARLMAEQGVGLARN